MALNVASQVVRSVLSSSPHGLPTKDIYRRALKASDIPKMRRFTPRPVVLFDRRTNGTLDSTSRSVNEGRAAPKVPNPTHPIRSMTYLKTRILPNMLESGALRHVQIPLSVLVAPPAQHGRKGKTVVQPVKSHKLAWVWQIAPEEDASVVTKPKNVKTPTIPIPLQKIALNGAAPNLDHLSRRRRRSRLAKHPKVLATMKEWSNAKKAYQSLQVETNQANARKAEERRAQAKGEEQSTSSSA